MKVLVINLQSRPDRLKLFEEHWNWFQPIERIEGIVSNIPHTGSSLTHCKAIRRGLENNDMCLILEDDARLNCPQYAFINILNDLQMYKNNYDAISLGPVFDSNNSTPPEKVIRISEDFMRCSTTKSIESTVATVWTRRALRLIDKYEDLLNNGYIFPIDRMLTSFSWVAAETVWWNNNWTIKYPLAKIDPPAVLIANKCFLYEAPGIISDNTYEESQDKINKSEEYLRRIYSGSTKR